MPVESESPERERWIPTLFAGSVFASAFLIFLVQPMVGKRIVPWYGGVPSVWTLCLAFYQTTLFAGYAYAHFLIRYTPSARQLALHALLFGLALLTLPVLPSEDWVTGADVGPSGSILILLAVHVALPFLVLAATGPLLQAWFARRYPDRSPYPLYAVSNLGSVAALLGYPFLLEPNLTLSRTGLLWSLAFALTGAAVLGCAALARRGPGEAERASRADSAPLQPTRMALWVLLAGCAVVLLMGTTNEVCLDIASVPFLWILPLCAYLASFILCFGSARAYRRTPYVVLTVLALVAKDIVLASGGGSSGVVALTNSLQVEVALFCAVLFGACMVLHGELYRLRPPASSLTVFYLCVSGGGALGGILVGVVAPLVFDDYYELQLGLGLTWLLLLAACWNDSRGWLSRTAPRWRWALSLALAALLLGLWGAQVLERPADLLHQERSFFGVLRVREVAGGANAQRHLLNGSTLHGVQFRTQERRPTSYYGVQTGVGLALSLRQRDVPSRVGVVGLGSGTLAAYGRRGDRFRFYEIDPAVIRLARASFSYLEQSAAEVEIVEGDARISLAAERASDSSSRFDFLIIDAFSSDAIPVHLVTREAIEVYLGALTERGLLAMHASSQQLDLLPLLARLGRSAGLHMLAIENESLPKHLSAKSLWVFFSRDEDRLRQLERLVEFRRSRLDLASDAIVVRQVPADVVEATPLWTDDYSDLFGALRPLPLRVRIERAP